MWWIAGFLLLFWGVTTSISTLIFKSEFHRVMIKSSVAFALIGSIACFVMGYRKSSQSARDRTDKLPDHKEDEPGKPK